MSLDIKLLVYKTIIKPIWTYGIQIWGAAAKTNIEIIQRFQSKALRIITNAPWYICGKYAVRHEGSQIKYHEVYAKNPEPWQPTSNSPADISGQPRRLHRFHPTDLINRF